MADYIYTNHSSRNGKDMMAPVEGMTVTDFKIHDDPQVEFIAGNLNRDYLEEYFSENHTLLFILVDLLIAFVLVMYVETRRQKKG